MEYTWNYSDPYEYMRRVARNEMAPLIITVAITGEAAGKESNPNIPETPEEQAQQTYEAYKAGAASVHIHARSDAGDYCVADPARFREINRRIRELCPDIIIGNSTGAGVNIERKDVVNILDADPEVCSLNMGPISARGTLRRRDPPLRGRQKDESLDWVFPITFSEQESIARKALEKGVKPELEIYNTSMFNGLRNLVRQDLIRKPYWIQLVFGPNFELPSLPCFVAMINCLPPDCMFSVIGIGPFQLPMVAMSILIGGHVRVGLEDNIYYRKNELAKNNAQLVERVVRIAKELDREIATPTQARKMLGLSEIPKQY